MRKLIYILSILLLIGCTNQNIEQNVEPYHNICPLHNLVTQAADSVYRVYTVTTIKFGEDEKEWELRSLGNAFAISVRRFLTAGHLVRRDQYQVQTPYGILVVPISLEDKVREETWLLLNNGSRIPAEVIYKELEVDFAVLEIENKISQPVYSIGNSDDLCILDEVFVISDFGTGEHIKTGHITQLDFVTYTYTHGASMQNTDMFGICAALKAGSSGSPVFLFRNEQLEIGGLISIAVTNGQGLSYAVKINPIMNRLREWQNEREL